MKYLYIILLIQLPNLSIASVLSDLHFVNSEYIRSLNLMISYTIQTDTSGAQLKQEKEAKMEKSDTKDENRIRLTKFKKPELPDNQDKIKIAYVDTILTPNLLITKIVSNKDADGYTIQYENKNGKKFFYNTELKRMIFLKKDEEFFYLPYTYILDYFTKNPTALSSTSENWVDWLTVFSEIDLDKMEVSKNENALTISFIYQRKSGRFEFVKIEDTYYPKEFTSTIRIKPNFRLKNKIPPRVLLKFENYEKIDGTNEYFPKKIIYQTYFLELFVMKDDEHLLEVESTLCRKDTINVKSIKVISELDINKYIKVSIPKGTKIQDNNSNTVKSVGNILENLNEKSN